MKIKVSTITAILCLFLLAGAFGSCKSVTTTETTTLLTTETVSTTITTSAPTPTIMAGISREQAIALAATQFPSSVILQSKITTQIIAPGNLGLNYLWVVSFDDFTITRDALIAFGWLVSDSNTFLPNFSEYQVADVKIDSGTGTIVWKGASFIRMNPPALSTTTLKTS